LFQKLNNHPHLHKKTLIQQLNKLYQNPNQQQQPKPQQLPQNLVEARHQAIHLVNYEEKWENLRNIVNRTLDDLQSVYVDAQKVALRSWFSEVCKNMKAVNLKTDITRQLSDSDYVEMSPPEVPEVAMYGL
jgi:hypothetical protein